MLAPLPTSPDPHENVHELGLRGHELRDRCQVLVVGSGPGGAVVAKELAEAGRDVVLVEEGPPCGKPDFDLEPGKGMQRWFREGSARAARGNLLAPTMQAIALGGGSVFNSAICVRPPAWVFDHWAEQTGTAAITLDLLRPHFERVEALLGIAHTPEHIQGQRNLLFKKGCDALGISCEPRKSSARAAKPVGRSVTKSSSRGLPLPFGAARGMRPSSSSARTTSAVAAALSTTGTSAPRSRAATRCTTGFSSG